MKTSKNLMIVDMLVYVGNACVFADVFDSFVTITRRDAGAPKVTLENCFGQQ